jgi:hypothetical protein
MNTFQNRNNGTNTPTVSTKETCDAIWKTIADIKIPDAKRAALEGFIRGVKQWMPIMIRGGKTSGLKSLRKVIRRAEHELQKLPPAGLPFAGNN